MKINIYQLIYIQPIPRIILIMLFMILLWGFFDKLFKNVRQQEKFWKMGNRIVCGSILVIVFVITLMIRENSVESVCFVPFHSFFEAQNQSEIYRSMFMNVLLFFPLGLTLPFALPEKWNRKALFTIIFAFVFSFTIEFLQFHYHLGHAETDDVICNTLGAAIGTLSYTLERKFFTK